MASTSEKVPTSKGQAWFCTTGLPSDVVIEVDDMTFHLHKFPLMSKSRKLHDLITEQENNPEAAKLQKTNDDNKIEEAEEDEIEEEEEEEEEDHLQCHITLSDFPGGSEAFETAAKFCYGVKIDLSPQNVAPLRCAGDYLQMTDDFSEDNLISKTERYFSQTILKNIRDSLKSLTTCQKLLPLAETLGIVQRCIDSISSRASTADPSLFGWPVSDSKAVSNETNSRRKGATSTTRGGGGGGGTEAWLEELGFMSLGLFKRLISAMRDKDLSPEIIESCLVHYAKKYIPGASRSNRRPSSSSSTSSIPTESEQRELLETIISNLPLEKLSNRTASSTATRFFFGLLRTANILNASETCKATLEKRIGLQLEQATLDDLLIPSYSYLNETLYDVECVERILAYFLQGFEERSAIRAEGGDDQENSSSIRSAALMLVGKLIDGYLSEIATDSNLKPEKFFELAVALPDHARLFDDGLYRAVDVYLKAHPWITEAERERICGVMDCQKLTLEACTHAAQNERLPLRAVVQVLFFEQLQLRHAIAGTLLAADNNNIGGVEEELEEGEGGVVGGARGEEGSGTWRETVRENQVLRLDMDSMRTRVHELERECSTMKKAIAKIDKPGPPRNGDHHHEKESKGRWRSSLTRKFGCKFKTQVCDSHEPTVVEARKGRSQRHHHHQQ